MQNSGHRGHHGQDHLQQGLLGGTGRHPRNRGDTITCLT